MEQKFFHGNIDPIDVAETLVAYFNQANLRAQTFGESGKLVVQIATRPGARSGGQTALTVNIQRQADGVLVQVGQQAWLGTAASLGATAFSVLRNPLSVLGRIDDLAQDLENLQLTEKVWQIVGQVSRATGASHELSERLARVACDYCGTANKIGEPACIACGAPLGEAHPTTCARCGYVVKQSDTVCPNCGNSL